MQPSSAPPVDAVILAELLEALSRTLHDINNPLTIISGNAQLLAELGPSMDLPAVLQKPISDVEEASAELAMRIQRLARLREQLQEALAVSAQA